MLLFRHFISRLWAEVGLFVRKELGWGVIVFGLVSLTYAFVHLKLNSINFWDDLIALACIVVAVVFIFVIRVTYQTTKSLWHDPPARKQPLIILTDAVEEHQNLNGYHWQLLCISLFLASACIIATVNLGLFVYRTGKNPILSQEEQAEIGSRITAAFRTLGEDGWPQMPPLKPSATSTWVDISRGYLISCTDGLSKKVEVSVPITSALGLNVATGGFRAVSAIVIFREPTTGLSVLRVKSTDLQDLIKNLTITEAVFTDRYAKSGEPIIRPGFDVDTSGPQETTFNHVLGEVIRYDIDGRSGTPFGLYLSVPYRKWDCGSPVIDKRGNVIGIVEHGDSDSSENHTVAAPATYIKQLIKQAISNN